MKNGDDTGTGGRTLQLLRDTADGLGQLVVQHVKLARLELSAEVRALGARMAGLVVLAVLMVLGYALAVVGLAVLIAGERRLAVPLLAIGGVHLVGAALGALLVSRAQRKNLLNTTKTELDQSANALREALRVPSSLPTQEHSHVR